MTHNMQQAARISDKTGFFYIGKPIEASASRKRSSPGRISRQTEDYINGAIWVIDDQGEQE